MELTELARFIDGLLLGMVLGTGVMFIAVVKDLRDTERESTLNDNNAKR
jgi:hypothetical protein